MEAAESVFRAGMCYSRKDTGKRQKNDGVVLVRLPGFPCASARGFQGDVG